MTSDFVVAAISGAIGVINRCIPPINPTDPECFHMSVQLKQYLTFSLTFLFIFLSDWLENMIYELASSHLTESE